MEYIKEMLQEAGLSKTEASKIAKKKESLIFLFLFLKHMQHSSVTHLPIFAFQAFRVQNDTICQWTVPTHVSPYDKEIHPLPNSQEIYETIQEGFRKYSYGMRQEDCGL